MRKTNIILGFIIFIAPLFLIKSVLEEIEVYERGKIVQMKIVDKPASCLGTKVKWFMKIEYQGINFPKQISGNYCENHNIGDWVDIKYLEGSDILLLPNENSYTQLFSTILLSLAGFLAILYYTFFKKK